MDARVVELGAGPACCSLPSEQFWTNIFVTVTSRKIVTLDASVAHKKIYERYIVYLKRLDTLFRAQLWNARRSRTARGVAQRHGPRQLHSITKLRTIRQMLLLLPPGVCSISGLLTIVSY